MTASRESTAAPHAAFYQSVLAPHPSTPCDAVRSIEVRLARPSADRLDLTYVIEGDLRRVRWPDPAPPRRADGLWRRTCFEAFIAPDRKVVSDAKAAADPGAVSDWRVAGDSGIAYIELNFSPSRAWAAYAFTGYREGMEPVGRMAPPEIAVTRGDARDGADREGRWVLRASTWIDALSPGAPAPIGALSDGVPARIALAAVIEESDGRLSYWAVRHPPGRPDFHHPDGFALRI